MLPIITDFLKTYNPYLQPFFLVIAWVLFALLLSTLINSFQDITKRSKIMHKIPCTRCKYFTNDYRLKCTLQPLIANTEAAMDCPDFIIKENW
ncbi:MAG: hypothetical protein GW795_11750 [Cyanobacteria bacterium]|uniref:hypothetical protein n=1 Tax=Geminocystis sp. TaxID=2664100 RepID=UPI001DE50F33|nr:hypothetical protein [Cyanobacteria bacterium CG_2015-16_32_12]NCO77377.1 hypothetical protein [Cyanobacteria bacterium CG_2015-22_32_23]NCQ05769.1 hypothetical protein [Cyanobacteria bacterium CG_2015-09_32_10]NCQ42522.1 hypothetical protein [Cyanobacteria bacterium CG_2015-04_32_10]NCS83910.1 hypothetical protein [Cyanobacteria bacterium CG_2015-02_32_10]